MLVAVSAVILAINGFSITYAQETPSVSGELERHAPIIGNTTISQAELEKILASLGNNVTDPRISSLLSRMNDSLRAGDYDSYNKAREELKLYLNNLTLNKQELPLDLATIEKLALLASTSLYGQQGVLNSAEFAKLVSELGSMSSGGGEAELNNLFNSTNKNQSGSKEEKPPSIPQVPRLNAGKVSKLSIGFNPESFAMYLLGIGVLTAASYFLYRYRSILLRKLLGLTGMMFGAIKYREPEPSNPREAIIYCFKRLTKTLGWIGFKMASWETPREYISRVSLGGFTPFKERIIRAVEKAKYSPRTPEPFEVEECNDILERVNKL